MEFGGKLQENLRENLPSVAKFGHLSKIGLVANSKYLLLKFIAPTSDKVGEFNPYAHHNYQIYDVTTGDKVFYLESSKLWSGPKQEVKSLSQLHDGHGK